MAAARCPTARRRTLRRAAALLIALSAVLPHQAAAAPAPRLVTLAPNLTELVFAAGAGDRLVGVTRYSDFPAAARTIPRVGDGFNISAETLLALQPDLVLTWPGGTPAAVIEQLDRLGLAHRLIAVEQLDDVPDAVRTIGALAATAQAAERAATALEQRITALQPAADQPRVFYQVSARPIYTLNGTTAVSDVIERCGGVNVFAELPMTAPQVGRESVVMARPDVILLGNPSGARLWRGFNVIPAVANDRLVVIDADLLARAGPRLVDGAEAVCSALSGS